MDTDFIFTELYQCINEEAGYKSAQNVSNAAVTAIWYPQIFRTRGYHITGDLIPGGVLNPCSSWEGAVVFCVGILLWWKNLGLKWQQAWKVSIP